MSLTTPESVQKLQAALHDKAKKSPNFRFYALYDKVYRKDVLAFAYACSRANGEGAAAVPGLFYAMPHCRKPAFGLLRGWSDPHHIGSA
jgi:hypothetical protein